MRAAAALVLVLATSACSGGSSPATAPPDSVASSPAPENAVTIKSLLFSPPTITVKSGDSVVWTNQDPARHTVTSGIKGTRGIPGAPGTRDKPDGVFDATVEPGTTVTITLDKPGRYPYFCRIHAGMTGTVIVK